MLMQHQTSPTKLIFTEECKVPQGSLGADETMRICYLYYSSAQDFWTLHTFQGKTQPLPDRVHAPSKLFTFMEISRSFTCFSGTELIVHTTQRQPDAYVWPLQQTKSYSFRSQLLCPNLPNGIVVEQQKSHAVPDAPGSNSTEVTRADCERNLCVI